MSWQNKHPVESIVEWTAPFALALSLAWACLRLGFGGFGATAAGAVGLVAAIVSLRLAGRSSGGDQFAFELAELDAIEAGPDELLLGEADEVLELDDPLAEIAPDARVVQLFARQEPTPGELVERIADFLGEGRRPVAVLPTSDVKPADASAALQAALANIRASLR